MKQKAELDQMAHEIAEARTLGELAAKGPLPRTHAPRYNALLEAGLLGPGLMTQEHFPDYWYDCSDDLDFERDVEYLVGRGLLQRHPEDSQKVQVLATVKGRTWWRDACELARTMPPLPMAWEFSARN